MKQFKGTPKLKELCKHLKVEVYDEGQTIIQEGEYGETFYIIYTGRVTILKFKKNDITGMINMVRVFNPLTFFLGATCRVNCG